MNKKLIDDYKKFLDNGKTERECVVQIAKMAEEIGYKDINSVESLNPGDKVYIKKMDKAIALFNIGTENIENGMNILGAHIDSPRLDNSIKFKNTLFALETRSASPISFIVLSRTMTVTFKVRSIFLIYTSNCPKTFLVCSEGMSIIVSVILISFSIL